jgi:hypothetical protein
VAAAHAFIKIGNCAAVFEWPRKAIEYLQNSHLQCKERKNKVKLIWKIEKWVIFRL